MKNRNITFTIVLAVASFALSPIVQAVSPAPDGGYPGFNTAEGQNALFSLTTGQGNTAVGWFSLWSVTAGSLNTATGAGALLFNTADNNTAFGAAALLFNTTGIENTAIGTAALLNNTEGGGNTATGFQALQSNTTGGNNTANGWHALLSNTEGVKNTAAGVNALRSNTIGTNNTANGFAALFSNTAGFFNTANGVGALVANTIGINNTAIGYQALSSSTGSGNIALGADAGASVSTANNVISIGHPGDNISDSSFIGNIFGVTSPAGVGVFINANGQLGTTTSSRRFKEEIKPMERASEVLFALKPVTFRYKKGIDAQGIPQFGLVAEDVEAVNPDLVVRDKEGKVNTVRYDAINAMLLNEFLKEHRKVQEQEASIAQMKKGMDALVAHIKEQDSKIQKVSDRVEMSKAAAQVATIK
jgi:trimeric autotransporter adhesin